MSVVDREEKEKVKGEVNSCVVIMRGKKEKIKRVGPMHEKISATN